MKIYTGYFAQIKKYQAAGLTPISIARWTPKWFDGETFIAVAPSVDLLNKYKNGLASVSDYTVRYNADLAELDRTQSLKTLVDAAVNGRDVVFCCYEKIGDFCHRNLFADYMNKTYGYDITEFPIGGQYDI